MNKNNKTVFVGVSGGVDSSVSAALLKDQGYNVVGVFIRTWSPDFIECTWKDERRDAMRVCAHLDIPFLECDGEEAYKKGVADYMIEEYKRGNTPNPDVMCNREVKFGIFWQFAKERGADFIATGHYAVNYISPCQGGVDESRGGRPLRSSDHLLTGAVHLSHFNARGLALGSLTQVHPLTGEEKYDREKLFFMERGVDNSKDQVYFLWTLTQEDLEHTLFPIGYLEKSEVRKLAEKYKIGVAKKKDSQGVCFLGPLDMKDFLKHYIETKKGDVLLASHDSDLENDKGEIIGSHDGAIFFTLGERHGFNIFKNKDNSKPLYVVAKDIEKNTITVSSSPISHKSVSHKSDLWLGCTSPTGTSNIEKRIILCSNTNWISATPKENKNYTAQIRYHGEFLNCQVSCKEVGRAQIMFEKDILIDKGQSIVIYEGDVCLGGGIVT